MRTEAKVYFGAVVAAAVLLLLQMPWQEVFALPAESLLGLSAFIGLGLLAQGFGIRIAPAGTKAISSIAFLPLLACAIVFPPSVAVAAAFAIDASTQVLIRRVALYKGAFNIAQGVLITWAAASVHSLLLHLPVVSPLPEFLAVAGLTITFFASNALLVSAAVSLLQNQRMRSVAEQVFGSGGGNLFYDLLASPVALIAAVLYEVYYVPGLVVIILPLLLIRYSYLSKADLEKANRDLLTVLIKAIETRDPYTSGHSLRVSTLARAVAEDLGLHGRSLDGVERAALLHDIGKIDAEYAPLISKRSGLSPDERALIRTHAERGAAMLEALSSVEDEVIRSVRHHHEHYDGNGYPSGLSGQQIPLAARIIMLCDSIDAMLSDRPYRKALTRDQVHAELLRCSGTQFDPELVRVILERGTLARAASLIDNGDRQVISGPRLQLA